MGTKRVTTNQIEEVLVTEHIAHRDRFYKILSIEGRPLRFEIDSGAAVSIVSAGTVRRYFPWKKLQTTSVQLLTFCKTSVKVIGVVPVAVAWRGSTVSLNLYVTNVDREPLLGRE